MALITSISGIRGTIGGKTGKSLSPIDIVRFTTAYALFIKKKNSVSNKIIIGRDARVSGKMVSSLVSGSLISCGFDVLDLGLSTTPTVGVLVALEGAAGGIVITASHNPFDWNALKLLNNQGEFLSAEDGGQIISIASSNNNFSFASVDNLGKYCYNESYNEKHIEAILKLDLVDIDLVRRCNFKVVVDAVNSTGGIMVPLLLDKMGVDCIKLFCDPNGIFPHNPEPLPENLKDISLSVLEENAHLGIVVDPDVDRLALICNDGTMFGEEYTLVAISDFILSKTPGNTVSNLSSTRALKDVTDSYNCTYSSSSVGEVNVVKKMKEVNAVIGGEGNGGVIYPSLHYGRDALVGIALFLTHLAESKVSSRILRNKYPDYFISKNKLELNKDINLEEVFDKLVEKYEDNDVTMIDGFKVDFNEGWVHLRKSNTEPIIRVYAESKSLKEADELAKKMINEFQKLI